jgi:4a-hydroxytetrahydrobiopterin dehydratase
MARLNQNDVRSRLSALSGWELDDDEIQKKYKFSDFREAMTFVNRVAQLAEAADHHPDIEIKYNSVKLELSTHSEGGLTEKDFALATQIDAG